MVFNVEDEVEDGVDITGKEVMQVIVGLSNGLQDVGLTNTIVTEADIVNKALPGVINILSKCYLIVVSSFLCPSSTDSNVLISGHKIPNHGFEGSG